MIIGIDLQACEHCDKQFPIEGMTHDLWAKELNDWLEANGTTKVAP